MKSTRKLLPLAIIGLFAGVVAPNANASVVAQSVLSISNFKLSSGGTALDVSDFSTLAFSDNTNVTATLGATTSSTSQNQTTLTGLLDATQQCVGNCGAFGQNDFSPRGAIPTTTVVRGDSILAGSPITDTANGLLVAGALANTVAEGQIIGTNTGSADSNLGLISTFKFILAADKTVDVTFSAVIHLIAALTLDSVVPGSNAQAIANWGLSIVNVDNGDELGWDPQGGVAGEPCDLNRQVATQIPGVTRSYDCAGDFSKSFNLLGNTLYELNLKHISQIDVASVPEPASVALLGLGLIGLGFSRRRAQK